MELYRKVIYYFCILWVILVSVLLDINRAKGFKGIVDYIKQFCETDFTVDLQKIDVATLFIHGDDDQIFPIAASALLSVKLIKDAKLKIYKGAPHGLCATHKDKINDDLLAFIKV